MNVHKYKWNSPSGQSLIEMTLLLIVTSSLMIAVIWTGVSGFMSIQAAHGARLAVFDCDMRPGHCITSIDTPEQHVRVRLFSSGKNEVLARDDIDLVQFDSLGRDKPVLERPEAIQVRIDLPRVDGADKGLFAKMASAFRGFAGRSGPAIFELSAPDQFTRATATAVILGSQPESAPSNQRRLDMPQVKYQSRVALLSDSWAAIDSGDFANRTRKGESPSEFGSAISETFYTPAKDVLMPVFDLIGLDHGTRQFRDAFHKVKPDSVYPETKGRR